jgi:hypothetical protein
MLRVLTLGWSVAVLAQEIAQDPATQEESPDKRVIVEELKYKQHPGLAYAASKIYFADQRYSISGFGEVNAVLSSTEQDRSGGDLELYYTNLYRISGFLGYKIKPNLIFNFEFLGELLQNGTQEFGNDIVIEAMLDYLIKPEINLRFGFYPITIGYINNNDEPVMFRSVNRPEVERLIIPSSWISLGVMAFGAVPRTRNFSWAGGVVAGLDAAEFQPGSWIRQGRHLGGVPRDPSAVGQLLYQPREDFQFGLSGYAGNSGAPLPDSSGRLKAPTSIGAVHSRYRRGPFTIVGVGTAGSLGNTAGIYELTDRPIGARTYGWYVEPSYAIRRGKLPLFARVERLNTHARVDSSLQAVREGEKDLRIFTLGANYLPRPNIVLKANYQLRKNNSPFGGPEPNMFEMGFGFIF